MRYSVRADDIFGLIHPAVDAHTLGVESFLRLLRDCGLHGETADPGLCEALDDVRRPEAAEALERWIRGRRISVLGLSYRLAPDEGERFCTLLIRTLRERSLFDPDGGGPVRAIYFAGLGDTCARVRSRCTEIAGVFPGGETPSATLAVLGISAAVLPPTVAASARYDEDRLAFGRELVGEGGFARVPPPVRDGYREYGTHHDHVVPRILDARRRGLPPVVRAHVGPYLPDRREAVSLFLDWARRLASSGYLDVLSIGTSQLSQEAFGEEWGDRPDGGGVPLNSAAELAAVRQAAGPMLVRCYAGTTDVPRMARLFETTLNTAWHALSFWWFSVIDGRGPNTVPENVREHLAALRFVASSGKPFEPNTPHHFAFRGADDATCVVSAILAARAAKQLGVRWCIIQNMLATPRATWGVNDLARSRVLWRLARELEGPRFSCFLQTRGGLDSFSPDPRTAMAQLAAVTALMDDIEPENSASPDIIHVVSYSEGYRLADPAVVDESIRITLAALERWRSLRSRGLVSDSRDLPGVRDRERELEEECRSVLAAIDALHPDPADAGALHEVFARGFLPVPYLWKCREEYPRAVRWKTAVIAGAVRLVDADGRPLSAAERIARCAEPGA